MKTEEAAPAFEGPEPASRVQKSHAQPHRRSNSFTKEAVAAFQAMHRMATQDMKFLAILRSAGMKELARKFGAMAKKDAEREENAA